MIGFDLVAFGGEQGTSVGQVFGGKLLFALLAAAEATGHPAQGLLWIFQDRCTEQPFCLRPTALLSSIDTGVVKGRMAADSGLNPFGALPVALFERGVIELCAAQIGVTQISAVQTAAAEIGAAQ